MWFFAASNGRYSLCGKRFWSRCKNNENAQRISGNETIQNFKECTGTSKRQTGEDRLNRMCVQSSLCQLWLQTYIGETGRKFGVRLQEHRTEVESKTGRTFTRSLRASSLTEHNKCALIDHATQENHIINWSQATVHMIDRARAFYQMDQRGHTHPKRRTTGHEPSRAATVPTEPSTTAFLTWPSTIFDMASSRRVKNRKNWVPASSDEGLC